MNRYQKPEVYEQLAMEYSLGTLHGRARDKFEGLMIEHPYLQAIVDDNDSKFSELVVFLPETKPDDSVWDNISARINESERELAQGRNDDVNGNYDLSGTEVAQTSWWQFLSNKGLAAAMVLLLVSAVFLLKPWSANLGTTSEAGFAATLTAVASDKPMVDVQIKQHDLMLAINLMERVEVPVGMKPVFWCIAKDKSKPIMNMGVVAPHGMTIKQLGAEGWQGIVDASEFAVSLEPEDSVANSSPSGDLIFIGKLKALTKT
ncbi:MAG: anti-sigma factor [Thiotrichaceae bacterium]